MIKVTNQMSLRLGDYPGLLNGLNQITAAAAAAKSLQSCLTLCDPRDGSPPGFPVPGILQYTQIIDCPMLGHLGCFWLCADPKMPL